VRAMILVLLVACGPKSSKPRYDTAKLARELQLDLRELGAIAKRHLGDCKALIAALDPHVVRMEVHAEEVKRVQQDVEAAKRLRLDVKAYDAENKGLAEAIGGDLGETYKACPDNEQLLQLIDRIPEL